MHFKTLQNINLPQIVQSSYQIYSYLMAVSYKCFLPPGRLSILVFFNITFRLYFYLIALSHLPMCDSFMGVDTCFIILLETSDFKKRAYCTFYQASWKLAQQK